jgi:hypothetical protein
MRARSSKAPEIQVLFSLWHNFSDSSRLPERIALPFVRMRRKAVPCATDPGSFAALGPAEQRSALRRFGYERCVS